MRAQVFCNGSQPAIICSDKAVHGSDRAATLTQRREDSMGRLLYASLCLALLIPASVAQTAEPSAIEVKLIPCDTLFLAPVTVEGLATALLRTSNRFL